MVQENIFKITVLISLLLHGAILVSLPYFKSMPKKKAINFEVTYRGVSPKIEKQEKQEKQEKRMINKELLPAAQRTLPKVSLPENKPKMEQPQKFEFPNLFKPKETTSILKPQSFGQSHKVQKISLNDISEEASKEPAYLGYRDIIRKKIQDKVYFFSDQYFYFDNPREGKVFVSFVVDSNGALKGLSIAEDKSSKDSILRKIVDAAIQNASPFQKFPQDLKYDERSFNLEISFEIE
jgi:TonB family protein